MSEGTEYMQLRKIIQDVAVEAIKKTGNPAIQGALSAMAHEILLEIEKQAIARRVGEQPQP